MPPKPCVILVLSALAMPAGAAETEANAIFLVAAREMRDPRFREAVVLVTQPRQGGPWGVIVNKPLGRRLAEVITDHESLKNSQDVVYFGGPVSPQGLVFLVRSAQPPARAVAVLQGVYFTSDADWIDRRLRGPDPTRGLRAYAGYAAWRAGQLQNEMRRGDWHVLPADAETVFDKNPARVWPELIKRATTRHTRWNLGGSRETENVNRETSGGAGEGVSIHDLRFTIHERRQPPAVRRLAAVSTGAHP